MSNDYPKLMRFNLDSVELGLELVTASAEAEVPPLPLDFDALVKPEVRALLKELEAQSTHVVLCGEGMTTADLIRAQLDEAGLGDRVVVIGAGPGSFGKVPAELFRDGPPLVELLADMSSLTDRFSPWHVDTPKNEPWYRRFAKERHTGKRF